MSALWQKMSRYKLWIGLVAALALAGFAANSLYAGNKPQEPAGKTVAVTRGSIASVVSATGTIKPVNMVDISSKISGLVKEVKVNENDVVTAGQVLLVLDDTRLQSQVSQAGARLNNTSAIYERSQRLNAIGAVSDQQLEAALTDYNISKANYDDAMSQLAETVIRTPIDGRIIGKPIPAGQTVAPGISSPMVLMTVADMSKLQIETQVDESDIGKIKVGQKVSFTVDAYPGKTMHGIVARVSEKATIQQNVVYYGVVVDVDGKEEGLKPTMTARVSINVGESQNTLLVPLTAVKSGNGKQYVIIAENGVTRNAPVTTGLMGEDKVEILSGVAEGDQVVLAQAKAQGAQAPAAGGNMFRMPTR